MEIGKWTLWLIKAEFPQSESKLLGDLVKSILVLDDEFKLLKLVCRLLQRHGYSTLEAGTADEALQLFHDNHGEIELFIADMCLPAGSGLQVAIDLRVDLPDLRILLVSGYPQNAWSARDSALSRVLGSHLVSILQKPFTPQILIDRVDRLIGAAPPEVAKTA
jgi:CheY-like chemotaxis protein